MSSRAPLTDADRNQVAFDLGTVAGVIEEAALEASGPTARLLRFAANETHRVAHVAMGGEDLDPEAADPRIIGRMVSAIQGGGDE